MSASFVSDADIRLIKNIIDVVTSRGAIKPDEFIAVGALLKNLDSILDQSSGEGEGEPNEPQLLCETEEQLEFDLKN
jgi:hypothetical protein